MIKKIVTYLISVLVFLIIFDSASLNYKFINKPFIEFSSKNFISIVKKSYMYINKKYEYYLSNNSTKHKKYWKIDNQNLRKDLKKTYTVKKTNDFTKSVFVNPINIDDWERSHGNSHSNRFSNLDLINRSNIVSLDIAWIYNSNPNQGKDIDIQCNPIIVDGIVYTPVVGGFVVAIDGTNGQEIWRSKKLNNDVARRGIIYWKGTANIEPRIFFSNGSELIALNAKDGKQNKIFLNVKIGYSKITPIIYQDQIIIASEKKTLEVYDIYNGKLKWKYFFGDNKKGRFGGNLYDNSKGGNPWGGISADLNRGIVYITTGNPYGNAYSSFDGTRRPGKNKNSSSLIAIDLNKKSEIWSFQETTHDIWNFDLPGPPILTSIIRDNHKIDVVIVATKRANTLILDRVSGKNIFDLNYRVAEASTVPGEKTSLYQLDLKIPEPFGKNVFNKNDITNISDESADYINLIVKGSKFGFFKPVSLNENTIIYNFHGGAEWMGASIDHTSQTMYVNSNNIPWNAKLIQKENKKYSYNSSFSRLVDQNGFPGSKPPWGTISSMNLNTGKINWTIPFGYYSELKKKNIISGTENFGGVTATKGNLIFATGTLDSNIYAYDTFTGEQLWEKKLPYIGSSPPSIYKANREQYVIVQSTGSASLKKGYPDLVTFGDAIVAFKLNNK